MSKLLLLLGNGFSIDFITSINKSPDINLSNLFALGHTVKFPGDKRPGFLSHQHCPSLWTLGARPTNETRESVELVEEIITCANMFSGIKDLDTRLGQGIYIDAYMELISYIRHLFICYNEKVSNMEISSFVNDSCAEWGWKSFFAKELEKHEQTTFITYNYDLWLERVLSAMNIDFSIVPVCAKTPSSGVSIIKPHGSIDFVMKNDQRQMFSISKQLDTNDIDIQSIECVKDDLASYRKSILIPPSGESFRHNTASWAAKLRETAINAAIEMRDGDEVFVCGISYGYVDRRELDELFINLNSNVKLTLINPTPPPSLNAVLVSLFKKYVVYTSSNVLGGNDCD